MENIAVFTHWGKA